MLSICAQPSYIAPQVHLKSVSSETNTETETSVIGTEEIEQPDSTSIESTNSKLTVLTLLDSLNTAHKAYLGSRSAAQEIFDLHYGFISHGLIKMSKGLLKLASNKISNSELAEFTAQYTNLYRKVKDLKAIRPELRQIDNALSELYESLTGPALDETQLDKSQDVNTFTSPQSQFNKNIRSALSLLRNEKFGFGRSNLMLNQIKHLVSHAGIEDLQLPQLFEIVANLDKLTESEMQIRESDEQDISHALDENPKCKVIQFLRQAVFIEINKEQGNHLKLLKQGLNQISADLGSIEGYTQEKAIVRSLQKKTAAMPFEGSCKADKEGYSRALQMFEISEGLTKLASLLNDPEDDTDAGDIVKIQEEASKLQKLFSRMPSVKTKGELAPKEISEGDSIIENFNLNQIQGLKDILSEIQIPLRTCRDPENEEKLRQLLILLNSFGTTRLQKENWLDIQQRITIIWTSLNRSPDRHPASFGSILPALQHALRICKIRIANPGSPHDTFAESDDVAVPSKIRLTRMLLALEPLLKNALGTIDSAAYQTEMTAMVQILRIEKNTDMGQYDFEKIVEYLGLMTDKLDQASHKAENTSPMDKEKMKRIIFVKQNIAAISNLCEISSSKFEGQFDPRSRLGFLKIFKKIRCALKGIDGVREGYNHTKSTQINPILDEIYRRILSNPSAGNELSLEDWEFISLKLETITKSTDTCLGHFDHTKFSEDFDYNGFKIGFIKKNLQYLAFVSGAAWASKAHKQIVEYLTYVVYQSIWDQSYSTMFTHKVSFSGGIPLVNIGGSIAINNGELTDDEGYTGRLATGEGGFNFTFQLGLTERIKAASVGLDASHARGFYEEWDSNRKKIIADFQSLIVKHSNDPFVATYLKRQSMFDLSNNETSTEPEIKPVDTPASTTAAPIGRLTKFLRSLTTPIEPPDRIETMKISLENIDRIQTLYDLQSEHMSNLFSTLLSVRPQQQFPEFAHRHTTNRGMIQASSLEIEKAGGLKLNYKQSAVSVKGHLGLVVPGIELSVEAAGTGTKTDITLLRDNPLCRKMERLCEAESYNEKSKSHTLETVQEIRNEIAQKSMGLREKLDNDALQEKWRKDRNISKDAKLDRDQQEKLTKFLEDKARERRSSWSRPPLSDLMTSIKLDHLSRPVQSDVPAREVENLKRDLKNLEMEFERYAHLQAQIHHGDKFTRASIDAMHKRYGAEDAEHCMYRMLLLTAWLYTRALEIDEVLEGPSAATETLKKNLIRLEKNMHGCKFSVNKQTLNQLSTYREECILQTTEGKLGASASASVFGAISAKISVDAKFRIRHHINPLRRGDYRDIEIRLSPGFNLIPKSQMMEYIRSQLAGVGPDCFPDINEYLDDKPLPGTTPAAGITLNFRYFKPALFPSLGFRFWNLRVNQTTDVSIDTTVPIPFGMMAAGYKYSSAKTNFVSETYPTNSILYLALRYYHDYTIKDIKSNGDVGPLSYWATVKDQQQKTLREMFLKTGNAETSNRKATKAGREDLILKSGVIEELDAIEAEIGKISKNREEHGAKIGDARKAFMEAVCAYSEFEDDESYEAALKGLENLLLAYSPRLITMKKKSDLFKPKSFVLEST